MFEKEVDQISNKLYELELVSKFKNIKNTKLSDLNIDDNKEIVSKFSTIATIPNISKFSTLPNNVKSDLDITIPMNVDLWLLSEGKNRDGIITFSELLGAVDRTEGDIISFHDMDDMETITNYNITDECGIVDGGRIEQDEYGKNWLVASGRITNRNVAYQMYLKQLKGEPIEISAEFLWKRRYDNNGNVLQTYIRPKLISLVKSGNIKGNKIEIKDNIRGR